MEERISTIKKVELKKGDMQGIIMLDKSLNGTDLKFVDDEFDFYKEDIDRFVANYKNIGVVFKLTPIQGEFLKDWKTFLRAVIKQNYELDKFDNILVNKDGDKALLISNKRLLGLDLKKLNEKIEEINYRIESYNEKIEVEMQEELEREAKEQRTNIFSRIMHVLKR